MAKPKPTKPAPRTKPKRWPEMVTHHQRRAIEAATELREMRGQNFISRGAAGLIAVGIALVNVQLGTFYELRRMRKYLETPRLNAIGLTGRLISKEGHPMPDIGVFNPTTAQDVLFGTNLQWNGPAGAVNLAWTIDNGIAGALDVRPDGLAAKLITSGAEEFTAIVTVTDSATGITDTATVQRQAGGVLTAIGLSAQVVDK